MTELFNSGAYDNTNRDVRFTLSRSHIVAGPRTVKASVESPLTYETVPIGGGSLHSKLV